MDPVIEFEQNLTRRQRADFLGITGPGPLQAYLDDVRYCDDDVYHCPLTLVTTGTGCCFEGALFAAIVLRRLKYPPLILELFAENDDDHILAVYKKNGYWGAVAKSVFPGLRSRQPVYRTLRELAMSYFEFYFNQKRERTLRSYSMPLNLTRFDRYGWMLKDEVINDIAKAIDKTRHVPLFPCFLAKKFPLVDKLTFKVTNRF